jgi:hypothetical protein
VRTSASDGQSTACRPSPIMHCAPRHSFSPHPAASFQLAERSFGDADGCAPRRIRRGDCDSLFCVPANLNQSTTNAGKGVKKWQELTNWPDSLLICCWVISRLPLPELLLSLLSGSTRSDNARRGCVARIVKLPGFLMVPSRSALGHRDLRVGV